MANQTKLPLYQAQILRMWVDSPAHHPPVWRFSLEQIGTGARCGFADLDALIHHLLDLMEQLPEETQDRTALAQQRRKPMFFHQTSLEGLGCYSYMIGSCQTGECAVVDPQRDIADYLAIAADNQLRITHLIETHVHADHVSGSPELAARTGATIYIHKNAGVCFPHVPLEDGDQLVLGECRLDVLFTPGHTLDSICLLVTDTACGEESEFVLAGDTLFIGDVGRPDLVPGAAADDMAALLYASLHDKLMTLPDELVVYPGHGAGSLCGRSMQAGRQTTIGRERQSNAALQARSCDEFVGGITLNLPEQPAHHGRIK